MSALHRTRLLQMASQAFPVGGYSHSQGLESAIEAGRVTDEESTARWVEDVLRYSLGSYELPCLIDMSDAWSRADGAALARLNEEFLATRETGELRAATVQMGFSLRALAAVLPGLSPFLTDTLRAVREPAFPFAWSGLAGEWSIPLADSMTAYLWSWAENQVLVAMKSVPVGQSAGQRILLRSGEWIATCVHRWQASERPGLPRSNFAPGLALSSAQHETQYSRLFRS